MALLVASKRGKLDMIKEGFVSMAVRICGLFVTKDGRLLLLFFMEIGFVVESTVLRTCLKNKTNGGCDFCCCCWTANIVQATFHLLLDFLMYCPLVQFI